MGRKLEKFRMNNDFFMNVLFSDESTFTNHGQVNKHNLYYWVINNPHWLCEVERQRPWAINVWCGIVGKKLIGPYFIDDNGEKYRNFLVEQLPLLLEELSLSERMTLWYQHNGCPAHHSLIAREILNRKFNGRWIGQGRPVNWPARSPDFTAPDFLGLSEVSYIATYQRLGMI